MDGQESRDREIADAVKYLVEKLHQECLRGLIENAMVTLPNMYPENVQESQNVLGWYAYALEQQLLNLILNLQEAGVPVDDYGERLVTEDMLKTWQAIPRDDTK